MRRKIFLIIFGFVISLFATELLLRLSGHIYYQEWMRKEYSFDEEIHSAYISHMEKVVPEDKNLCKIMCVGDSWTFGLGASPGYSYPAQLQRILNREYPKKYKVYNWMGIPGRSSAKLLKYLPKFMKKYTPNIVIILIGMNDMGNPYPSELPLLLSGPKRYYYQLKNIIVDLRVYKLIRFGMDGLKKRIKISKVQPLKIKKNIDPESMKYLHMANKFFHIEKFETARNYYEKAINIDPDNEPVYIKLAHVYNHLRRDKQSVLMCKRLLKLNPYTISRGEIYFLLFLMYQRDNSPKDKIKTIIKNIPSDERFKNPGMPFVLDKERIYRNLRHNVEKMIKLIKSKKATPILQTYPMCDDSAILKRNLSEKYDIPFVDHKNFEKISDIKNYFGKSHPNEKGYYLMAENVYKVIKELE